MVKRQRSELPQRVVGVGTSAGGLDALKQLVERLPTDSGLAFVVLQHAPQARNGKLKALLAPLTAMPVVGSRNGQRLEPDHIVVVSPQTTATMFRGNVIVRAATNGRRSPHPIDRLFESLSVALGDRAIGIVLSGTGSDGTAGLASIQSAGGLTFAQDPASAQFDDMPRSAIAAGVAKIVADPILIASELESLATGGTTSRKPSIAATTPVDLERDIENLLLARYAPACVVVDDMFEVVEFRGRTSPYLEQPSGRPQRNVLRLARDGLATELAIALRRAQRSETRVRRENVVIHSDGPDLHVHVDVMPLASRGNQQFLVAFEDAPSPEPRGRKKGPRRGTRATESGELAGLRKELVTTKEYLHDVVTQQLVTSEKLNVTNEELQASNEELQASNEELQTAQEELQSTNEELVTLNDELHRGNASLRVANNDLLNVLASTNLPIIMVDTERRVRRFTETARHVLKLFPADIGRPIDDVQLRVGVLDLDRRIAQVIASRETHHAEVCHVDGSWYRMQIRPYLAEHDEIAGAVIAFVDITLLRAAREHASAIVESVPTPLVVLDEDVRVVFANQAFYAELAYSAAEAKDRTLLELGEWEAPHLRDVLATAARDGAHADVVEVRYTGRQGKRVWRVRASAMPMVEDGHRVLVGITDVTAQRNLEQAQAETEQERQLFLDAVSHELRTPLSAIMLWAEALPQLDGAQRMRAIDTILHSARAEAELVDDLLELSLSRTAALAVHVAATDAVAVVDSVIRAMREDAIARSITLDANLAPTRVLADPRRLRQIAASLLGNALKFTPAGGSVHVVLVAEGPNVVLRVRDTGPGISSEFLPRVFDAFSREDLANTRTTPGLGIGLTLVRHLVERQGGAIEVDSREGAGSTFTVRLPAAT